MQLHASIICPIQLTKEYDALFLDNDGTCGLTEEMHARIGTKILRENGVPDMTFEERFSFMGFGEVGIWEHLHKQGRTPSISADEFKRLQSTRFTEEISKIEDSAIVLRPGIKELALAFKEAGKPVWIVSNTPVQAVIAVQNAAGLQGIADGMITYTDMEAHKLKKKPAPDAYLKAKQSTLGDDARYLAVEDSKIGVQAAIDAHCDVIEIIYTRLNHVPHLQATFVVSDEASVLMAHRQAHGVMRQPAANTGGLVPMNNRLVAGAVHAPVIK